MDATLVADEHRRWIRWAEGELTEQSAWCGAAGLVDRSFESEGFYGPPLRIQPGDACVLAAVDRADRPTAALLIELTPEALDGGRVLQTGDFVPYFAWHPEPSEPPHPTLVCKGGTGRIAIEGANADRVRGTLAIRIACRTYLGLVEREQTTVAITGELSLDRHAEPPPAGDLVYD